MESCPESLSMFQNEVDRREDSEELKIHGEIVEVGWIGRKFKFEGFSVVFLI
jgi:hypothetical protein